MTFFACFLTGRGNWQSDFSFQQSWYKPFFSHIKYFLHVTETFLCLTVTDESDDGDDDDRDDDEEKN